MHLVKYMLKLIKKSVCICQLSEVKLFFSRLRVKKQVSRVELYVFFTNFFRSLFFPSLDRGVTKIPCAAGVRWQSSQYSWDMISQSLSPYLLPRGTITVIPVALIGIFLEEGGGKKSFPTKVLAVFKYEGRNCPSPYFSHWLGPRILSVEQNLFWTLTWFQQYCWTEENQRKGVSLYYYLFWVFHKIST